MSKQDRDQLTALEHLLTAALALLAELRKRLEVEA